MRDDFDAFMQRREAAAGAYCKGDPGPLESISSRKGPATFFDPGGGFTQGAEAVLQTNIEGASMFAPGGATRFVVHDSGASGDLGFWTGYQLAEVELEGGEGKVPMKLRISEVFRRDPDGWKMIHRKREIVAIGSAC